MNFYLHREPNSNRAGNLKNVIMAWLLTDAGPMFLDGLKEKSRQLKQPQVGYTAGERPCGCFEVHISHHNPTPSNRPINAFFRAYCSLSALILSLKAGISS